MFTIVPSLLSTLGGRNHVVMAMALEKYYARRRKNVLDKVIHVAGRARSSVSRVGSGKNGSALWL